MTVTIVRIIFVILNVREKESNMSKTSTQPLSQKKAVPTKLVMGLMVAAVSVLVSTASIASASPGNSGNGYGGNSGGINLDLSGMLGDNNVIVIIINYFVGQ